jgi:DNA replication protein DnaC
VATRGSCRAERRLPGICCALDVGSAEAEIARKDQRRITLGLSIAKFRCVRTLEGFGFEAQPSVDARQIRDLAACRWVANGDACYSSVLSALARHIWQSRWVGPPSNDSVLFTPATVMAASLAKAHAEKRLEERLAHYTKPKLLIVDELGYPPLEQNAAHLFFQLVSRRYERGSMLLTSNRSVGEWG